MPKNVIFSPDARESLKRGIDILADAVRATLGPKGRNVIIERAWGGPMVTKDGVTVAKEIDLEDPAENMGALLIKEVASKTADVAGDGTSTATCLAQDMVASGLKLVSSGSDPQALRRGIELAVKSAIDGIKALATPVKGDAVRQVASISANDPELGAQIADIMEKVGEDGVITIEDGQSFGVETEIVEGMVIERGYYTPYMITDTGHMEAEYKDTPILVTDRTISAVQEILPVLEAVAAQGTKSLVIVCEDVSSDVLTFFVQNKVQGTFSVLVIKAPSYGDARTDLLGDIAAQTEAVFVSTGGEPGFSAKDLGRVKRIISGKERTTIVQHPIAAGSTKARAKQLKAQIKEAEGLVKQNLESRLANLTGGIGVIRVGAASEVEALEKKHRIEDAVAATRAAVEEGIVPGGGTTLLRVQPALTKLRATLEGDEALGVGILESALEVPTWQIAVNAGQKGDVVVERVKGGAKGSGYNAATDVYEDDMIKAGIVDPAKVTRSAIENAASIATMVITTEVAVTTIQPPKTVA